MTRQGWPDDERPALWLKVKAADIPIVGTPIWLGEESSVCRILGERFCAMSGELTNCGQSVYHDKVAGAVMTGNEDGLKHVAVTMVFALNHLGCATPPQADCGWIGEAGPGASCGDGSEHGSRAAFDNGFAQRNATLMSWSCMHLAKLLKAAGGIPNRANDRNDRNAWKTGVRFDFENPARRIDA